MLEQDQVKSKVAINEMHDGLQALNTIVEESRTVDDGVKKYCDDKYKELQDKCDPPQDFQHNGDDTGTHAMTRHTKRDN